MYHSDCTILKLQRPINNTLVGTKIKVITLGETFKMRGQLNLNTCKKIYFVGNL